MPQSEASQTEPGATASEDCDVAIVGGGIAGHALALALAQGLGGELRVTVIEPATAQPLGSGEDPRALALSAGSRHVLEAIGVWGDIAGVVQPVREIDIGDSPLHSAARPTVLHYDNLLSDGRPASYVVESAHIHHAVVERSRRSPAIRQLAGLAQTFAVESGRARLGLADGRRIVARLVVAADGRQSRLREAAGIKVVAWDYPQIAIVTTVRHERAHEGRAVQHFLPAGPFALLPLYDGHRSSLVWSEQREEARRLLALDDAAFLGELERRAGDRLGALTLAGSRRGYPLSMHMSRALVADRLALAGDALRGVHPLAGQGLNLAFRDVGALAEVIVERHRLGLDIGGAEGLERYQRWRRFDSVVSSAAMDGLNRLFSNDSPILRTVRDLGLALIDRSRAMKQAFVEEAAGVTGDLPRLIRGEPL